MTLFPRGVRLEPHRDAPLRQGIQSLPAPQKLLVPLPGCARAADRTVVPGTWVPKNAPLSAPQFAAPAFAPAAGKIEEIQTVNHPLLGETPCAVLIPDWDNPGEEMQPPEHGHREQIIAAAASAGIVDEFDGQPLYKKLKQFRRRGVDLLLANAIDDDPYVSSAIATLRACPDQVLLGLEAAAKACGAADCQIAASSRAEVRLLQRTHATASCVAVETRYPARAMLKRKLYREGKKTGFIGVQACAALERTLRTGLPQTETLVTVTGDAVLNPFNLRVPLGTPLHSLLDFCGTEQAPGACFIGSSVTGRRVTDLGTPVTADTRCLIALKKAPVPRGFPCIGCGQCARACPKSIVPWAVYEEMSREKPDPLRLTNVQHCIACGACGLACPSEIHLTAAVLRAAEYKGGGA
ncbi:4Fe-4S dicluster domain-containing protein [Anaeromassilibacillus senegalensis]|uniref:4Fe-4S dicluster domain-containing protein n=1 Tax=Anaeromassilibacillus senegalensis TaxID=1673717 RepID=UPI0006817726|nr:4Fe-4S dicluster domain-containing protein [Anaeromassilibacillus senegalensis]